MAKTARPDVNKFDMIKEARGDLQDAIDVETYQEAANLLQFAQIEALISIAENLAEATKQLKALNENMGIVTWHMGEKS